MSDVQRIFEENTTPLTSLVGNTTNVKVDDLVPVGGYEGKPKVSDLVIDIVDEDDYRIGTILEFFNLNDIMYASVITLAVEDVPIDGKYLFNSDVTATDGDDTIKKVVHTIGNAGDNKLTLSASIVNGVELASGNASFQMNTPQEGALNQVNSLLYNGNNGIINAITTNVSTLNWRLYFNSERNGGHNRINITDTTSMFSSPQGTTSISIVDGDIYTPAGYTPTNSKSLVTKDYVDNISPSPDVDNVRLWSEVSNGVSKEVDASGGGSARTVLQSTDDTSTISHRTENASGANRIEETSTSTPLGARKSISLAKGNGQSGTEPRLDLTKDMSYLLGPTASGGTTQLRLAIDADEAQLAYTDGSSFMATESYHVATKEYVDAAVTGGVDNAFLWSISDREDGYKKVATYSDVVKSYVEVNADSTYSQSDIYSIYNDTSAIHLRPSLITLKR